MALKEILNGKKVCLSCKNEFEYSSRNPKKIKYCSKRCNDREHYKKNREKYINLSASFQRDNPEKAREYRKKAMEKFLENKRDRFNELMRMAYNRNKKKYKSRKFTSDIIEINPGIIDKKCKVCDKKENLTIHHEIYPVRWKKIKNAIKKGKIYYLCFTHHQQIHNNNKCFVF
jgi:hypothetical protein